MKLSELTAYLLHDFKSESDLIRAIEEISLKFTQKREHIEDYLLDSRLVSAYTAFYLTTNFPKLQAVTEWLTIPEREELKEFDLIDVGAGPGTFSLAWRELIGNQSAMIESSKLMREQAVKLFQGLYSEEAIFAPDKLKRKKLLLLGHSLNEMGVAAAFDYITKYSPDKIWLLEPGTKQSFAQALALRERLIRHHWQLRFPCLSSASCPMSGGEDWCHQYLHVRHDPEVERLTQLAGRDRRNLPMTVMMFEKTNTVHHSAQSGRIVRVLKATKFSYEWQVCNHENKLMHVEVPFKQFNKQELKEIDKYLSGHEISFDIIKELNEKWRVKLYIEKSE